MVRSVELIFSCWVLAPYDASKVYVDHPTSSSSSQRRSARGRSPGKKSTQTNRDASPPPKRHHSLCASPCASVRPDPLPSVTSVPHISFASLRSQPRTASKPVGPRLVNLFPECQSQSPDSKRFEPGIDWRPGSIKTVPRGMKCQQLIDKPDPTCPHCYPDTSRWAKYMPQRPLCSRCSALRVRLVPTTMGLLPVFWSNLHTEPPPASQNASAVVVEKGSRSSSYSQCRSEPNNDTETEPNQEQNSCLLLMPSK